MQKLFRLLILYIAAFILISCICGLVYIVAQQALRQGANDPQIQMAEDAAADLAAGRDPYLVNEQIDLNKSLQPFLGVYDKNGNPQDVDAQLDGQLPKPPAGVFAVAKQRSEYRVTWQPTANVRQALVIVPVGNQAGQFIVSGRSLREVENRENQTLEMVAAAWVVMIMVSFGAIFIFENL